MFIAASILVFATLGLFLFNQNGAEINTTNTVVGTETKIDTAQNKTGSIQSPIVESQKQNNAIATSNVQPANGNQQPTTNHQGVSINNQSTTHQNQIIKDKEIVFQNSSDVAQKDLPRIMEQTQIVVGKQKTSKSDESLLADLDKSVKESTNKKSSLTVDAKSLLSQVDGEVEYTFREKMLKKINKNYQEVKVALANRNNE